MPGVLYKIGRECFAQPPCGDRGPRLTRQRHKATQTFRAWQNRLEPTMAARAWRQLRELRFINNSLEFATLFTLGFVPFLMVLSAALGRGLTRAIIIRNGFSGQGAHDITILFSHGRTASISLSILGVVLAVAGGAAISRMLQIWYAKIFRARVRGWKAMARRSEWLAGTFGFVAMQVLITRTIQPAGGHVAAGAAQFVTAVAFWWWSMHCLLSGQIPWPRLWRAGLATAICYTGLGRYITYIASTTVVSNEARYGPIGAVMTLITAEIGLGVVLQLGAVIGANVRTSSSGSGRSRPGVRCTAGSRRRVRNPRQPRCVGRRSSLARP